MWLCFSSFRFDCFEKFGINRRRLVRVDVCWERSLLLCVRADVLFDVIFLPLFAVFRLEIKDTTVGTALYYRRCLLLRSRLQHTVAEKHCGRVG